MASIWDEIQARWPGRIKGQTWNYEHIRSEMLAFLTRSSIRPAAFSHFGLVVHDIEAAMGTLSEILGQAWHPAKKDWVQTYKVFVARGVLEGVEIEFIQPGGASFFEEYLGHHGEGLQHVSFEVDGIQACFERIKEIGTPAVDERVCQGSHGQIAFFKPAQLAPLFLELCQPGAGGAEKAH